MKKLVAILFSLAMILVFVDCKGKKGSENNSGANDAASNTLGQSKYEATCATCHGEKGLGDGPAGMALNPKARNFTKGFQAGGDLDSVVKTITNGFKSGKTGMAPYKGILKPEEIKAVAKYVIELSKKK